MITDAFKHLAPDLPKFKAKYRAVYLEPIVTSGERFTVGILAQSEQGEFKVIQTLDTKVMRCMYGEKSQQINNLIALILESATEHLKAQMSIESWRPPLGSVFLGDIQHTYSSAEMDGVLFQAITSYASLYRGDLIGKGLNAFNNESEENETPEEKTASLIHQVKDLTVKTNARFSHHWNKDVVVRQGAYITVDFLGSVYNANLSNFDVKHINKAFQLAKAKLFDLDVLREARKHHAVSSEQKFELLVSLKDEAPKQAKHYYNELEQLADSIKLRVEKRPTPQALAQRIIEQEAA